MAIRDWDDSWYDEEDFPPVRSNRGRGGIITAGVASVVMAGLNALTSTCFLGCGLLIGVFARGDAGGFLPRNFIVRTELILLGFGITSAIAFVMQMVAGIGLLNSRRWARGMSLFLGGYSALIAGLIGYVLVQTFRSDAGDPNERGVLLVVWGAAFLFHIAYVLVIFLTLLNRNIVRTLR